MLLHFHQTISLATLMLSTPPPLQKRKPDDCAPRTAIGIVKDKNCTPRFLFTPVAE